MMGESDRMNETHERIGQVESKQAGVGAAPQSYDTWSEVEKRAIVWAFQYKRRLRIGGLASDASASSAV